MTMTTLDPPDPFDPTTFGSAPWPAKFTGFRDPQAQAVAEVLQAMQTVDVVLLDAPTGAGKTIIGEAVRRAMHAAGAADRSLYVCSTLLLQDQFLGDFPYAKLLKGRSNYPTADRPDLFKPGHWQSISAADCNMQRNADLPACNGCVSDNPQSAAGDLHGGGQKTGSHCDWCHPTSACPYRIAKDAALTSELAVTNTSYFLAEANNIGHLSKNLGMVVVDEADLLEGSVMGVVEVVVGKKTRERLGIPMPEVVTHTAKSAIPAWTKWFHLEAIPKVADEVRRLKSKRRTVEDQRKFARFDNLLGDLRRVAAQVLTGGWVLTGTESGHVIFRPIKVDDQAPKLVFDHAKKWLLMSATLIDPDEFASSLGLSRDQYRTVRVPSTFPAERRPTIVAPVAHVTRKTYQQAVPKLATALEAILEMHPNERILVHTVSFALARDLAKRIRSPRVVVYDSGQRDRAVNQYLSRPNAMLLAASVDRGYDFAGDDCRVQVVARLPRLSLGDKQVSARLYSKGGQLWYSVATARTIVQSTGRGFRHDDDQVTTYILDAEFVKWFRESGSKLLPRWWQDALVWDFPVRTLTGAAGKVAS